MTLFVQDKKTFAELFNMTTVVIGG